MNKIKKLIISTITFVFILSNIATVQATGQVSDEEENQASQTNYATLRSSVVAKVPTRQEARQWLLSKENQSLDYDSAYGAQCVDLIKFYYVEFFGLSQPFGNGKDYATNEIPTNWTRVQYTPGFVPQTGDIAVWTENSTNGHVAVVLDADENGFNALNQNINGSPCIQCRTNYSTTKGFWGFIRPQFNDNNQNITLDTQNPIISNEQIINQDNTGYTIQCTVTDNVSVREVNIATWTTYNDQDDLVWQALTKGINNTYSIRINYSDHNNEGGYYNNHIYAYDTSGNSSFSGDKTLFNRITPDNIVSYASHIENIGDEAIYHSNGDTSGTFGQSLRLESIKIKLDKQLYAGSIEYRVHVQDYGWQDWKSDNQVAGTSGESKRLEAIQVRLTGEMANHYDVYYRVHAQNFGWLGWSKNGVYSGTTSYAYRLEAIEVQLVSKGASAPGTTSGNYHTRNLYYSTHIQNIGWQENIWNGDVSGTTGQALRLEGIRLSLFDLDGLNTSGSIQYRTHIQDLGWESSWKSDNQLSGTSGHSKRLEAIQIQLTGDIANKYDIYYRVHAQNYGWLGWTKNGQSSGTEGYSYRLEAIEVKLVEKNSNELSVQTTSFIKK